MILCDKCGCKVDVKKEGTQYYCPNCNENRHGTECFDTDDLMDILYGLYLHEWSKSLRRQCVGFSDIEPMCRFEFTNNELLDEEYMIYLLSMHGLWHRITEYKTMLDALQVLWRIEEYTKMVEEYKKMLEEDE